MLCSPVHDTPLYIVCKEEHSGRTMDEICVNAISTADRHVAAVPLLQIQAQASASTHALLHPAAA